MSLLVRRLLSLAGLGFAVLVALLLAAPQASAHAVVVSSDPADGARLAKAPATVTIRFDESVGVDLGYLRVVDTAGRRVDTGAASHPGGDGSVVAVSLRAGLGDGSYLASYRVVSADSHPVAGSIRFVIGNGPLGMDAGPSGSTPVNATVATVLAVSHWLSFAGISLVGGSWLIFSIWPSGQRRRSVRRAIWTGWTFAVLGVLGEFLMQGPYAAGSSLGTATHGQLLDATLHVNSGQLLSLRMVLLGVLGIVLTALFLPDERRRPSWGPEAAAIVGVGIVVTYSATGHAQSANPRWLAVLVDALHLSAMIIWLGGLAILVVAAFVGRRAAAEGDTTNAVKGPTTEDDQPDPDAVELAAGLPIFSRIALLCVATLTVTGTIQAWREVGTVDAITTTVYGRLVVIKVLLLAVLIGLGYLSRRIVQRRDWARSGGPLRRMRRTLLIEVAVGVVVLGVSGVLIAQPPGKVALAAERAKPVVSTVAITAGATARVQLSPGVHGSVQIEIELGGNVTPTQISATASLPAKQLGPLAISLQPAGPKIYTSSGVLLPSAGDWQIAVTVQTSEFDSTTALATVHLS